MSAHHQEVQYREEGSRKGRNVGKKIWIRSRGSGIGKCGAGAPRAPKKGPKKFLNFEIMKI
jgi:hypothetical protein